jgi:uncharacterized protein (DUF433 family)
MWDRQIEADLASGKLAPLIAQAEEDMATNNVRHPDEVLRNTPAKFQVTSPPFRWDEAGGIRIGSSRVTLDSILASYHNGSTPEEIAIQFSVLRLEDIYSAIAYYLNHRQEIDSYLEQRDRQAQQLRQQLTQKHNLVDLRQRLLARYQSKGESRQSAPSN